MRKLKLTERQIIKEVETLESLILEASNTGSYPKSLNRQLTLLMDSQKIINHNTNNSPLLITGKTLKDFVDRQKSKWVEFAKIQLLNYQNASGVSWNYPF